MNSRIRDQENLRAESEKERMRGNLLRAISHDLRTPLTSIYGSASTLISKKNALSEGQQLKLLGEIQEDSEGLSVWSKTCWLLQESTVQRSKL